MPNEKAVPQESPYCEVPTQPCLIVMFGASGDLAKRKLLPSLYDLAIHKCLAPRFGLLGFARTAMDDQAFRDSSAEFLPKSDPGGAGDQRIDFLKHLRYFQGNYDDPASYQALAKKLDDLDAEGGLGGNRLFYLATPPEVYPAIIEQLGKAGLSK